MTEWNVLLHDRVVQTFKIEEGEILTIGRSKDATVRIENTAISRFQASMQMKDGEIYIEDTNSLNGTFVNGEKIAAQTKVTENDCIEMGKFTFAMASKGQTSTAAPDFEATMYVPSKSSKKESAKLTVISGSASPAEFHLRERNIVNIGKGRHCDIRTNGFFVGAVQCSLTAKGDGYTLLHRGKWKKTTVNGSPVETEKKIENGDVIGVGKTKIKFVLN